MALKTKSTKSKNKAPDTVIVRLPDGSRDVIKMGAKIGQFRVSRKPGGGAGATGASYRYFTFNAGSGKFTERPPAESEQESRSEVRVFSYSRMDDIKRAQAKLPGGGRILGTVAIASPKVFNQPRHREALYKADCEVLVSDESGVKVKQLTPWIQRIVVKNGSVTLTQRPERSRQMASPAALDLSSMLRDDATGRLHAQKIAKLLGISMATIAGNVCGVSRQALSQRPASAGIQGRLQSLEDVAMILLWCGGSKARMRAWLNRPNADFPPIGGKTPSPRDLILHGHSEIVAERVRNMRVGIPA